jgi:hypothetical protein
MTEPRWPERPPTPKNHAELMTEMAALLERVRDQQGADRDFRPTDEVPLPDAYYDCIEAMWRAGYMTMTYMADQLQVSALQWSVAVNELHDKMMRGL